jgi:SAM-dependent methyltransferase
MQNDLRGTAPLSRTEKLLGNLDIRNLLGAEIGPLCRPAVSRGDGEILYVDHADTATLRAKYATDHGVDVNAIVDVDAVWGANTLAEALGRKVDYVVASHVIEHVPDLVTWLLELRAVLKDGGQVRLAVPDKRFTFDHLRRETSIADVLTAYVVRARRPQLQQILDFRLNSAPIDCSEAWATPIGERRIHKDHDFQTALSVARHFAGNDEYHDVHCWAFTPRSFALLFRELVERGLIDYGCECFYDTARNELEFFVWLKSMDRESALRSWDRMEALAAEFWTADAKLTTLRLEVEESRATIERLRTTLEEKSARIDALENSTSWRITAPLRHLRGWFGNLT